MGVVVLVCDVVVVAEHPLPRPHWRGGKGNAGGLVVACGGVGSGVVVKSFWTNSRRGVMRFDGVMLQTSVLLSRMQVRVGNSRPVARLVNIPLQWGSPCAIL